jgi:type VI secretion system secreted protein Hcp
MAALGAGGALAVAAIPAADGTIHACYNNDGGALRVVDSDNQCSTDGESAISWNQQGPQGPQGQKGDQGNKGDQGQKGDPGDSGQPAEPPDEVDAFLKLDGVTGGSQSKAHKGEIDILSFSWGVSQTGAHGGGGGGGAGKTNFQDLHFLKQHDRSSTKLFKSAATGAHIKSAKFTVVSGGQDVISYKLTDVVVTSYQNHDGPKQGEESVTFSPSKVEVSFNDNGTQMTSSFDIRNNKKPVITSFSFTAPGFHSVR